MREGILKKGLVVGVIMLFVGTSAGPSLSNVISETRDVIFFDDFNDNSKNYSKWTEIYSNGTWWERNQRTEFRLYETQHYSHEGIKSTNFMVTLTSSNSVNISTDMITEIEHSSNQEVGQINLKISNDSNWIIAYYERGLNNFIFRDSNDAGETILQSGVQEGTYTTSIEIFSDRYKVKMGIYESGWVIDNLFGENPTLNVQIFIKLAGSYPSYYWIAGFDNVLVKNQSNGNQPPVFGTPSPSNGSIGQPLSLTWGIPINDSEGNPFSWAIQCSNGQANSGTLVTNGTKTLALSGLAYSTTYKVWVNATDPTGSGAFTRRWYTFTTKVNLPPVFGTPSPANGSTGQPLSFTWSIPINDPEGNTFSWTIQCSNGQTNSGTVASNGTKTLVLSGLAFLTTYKVWVNATDLIPGSGLWTRRWYTFTTKTNLPPVFGNPTPANDSINQPLSFTWSIPINDPEGNTFSWTIQCSNGQTNSGSGATNGTKSLSLSGLIFSKTYTVWVNATDPGGSGLWTRRWYTFTTLGNEPPNTPSTPSGPSSLNIDQSGTYSTSSTDPDGDQVQFMFDWDASGSHSYSSWTSFVPSGTSASLSHSWSTADQYIVKSKVRDEHGLESESWSNGFIVTISGNQNDLSIISVVPVQTIWNPHAFIVGKKTALNVTILSTFNYDVEATFKITYNFGCIDYDHDAEGNIHYTKIKKNGETKVFLPGGPADTESTPWNFISYFWQREGWDNQIKVEIDPMPFSKVSESDETNNIYSVNPIRFYNSKDFSVVYSRFNPLPCHGWYAVSELDCFKMRFYSSHFIEETYPMKYGSISLFTNERNGAIAGWNADLLWLEIAKDIYGYDRWVGIGSDGYFQENGIGDKHGITKPLVTSSIVRAGYWSAPAHEIHHNLPPLDDWRSNPEEYQNPEYPNGYLGTGYRDWSDWGTQLMYASPSHAPIKGEITLYEQNYGQCYMGTSPFGKYFLPIKHTCQECYNHLIDYYFIPQLQKDSQFIPSTNNTVIHISGIINKNNSYFDKRIFVVENRTESFPNMTNGNYSIQMIDSLGQIIKEYYFNLSFIGIADNGRKFDTDFDVFVFRIPYTETLKSDLERIRIKHETDVLAEQIASKNPPVVQVKNPLEGEQITIGDNYIVSWNASDLDGDKLIYAISLSIDNGKTWIPLSMDINSTQYSLNTTTFTPSSLCKIRVIAMDGFNMAFNDSGIFSLIQTTLFADTHGPYGGMINSPILFNGSVSGGSPPYTFLWEFGNEYDSNEQNPIYRYTKEGIYTVTLTVTDYIGYCDRIQTTVYIMNESSFHKTLFIGFINCTIDAKEFILFDAKLLASIDLSSFIPTIYKSNTHVLITKDYLGFVKQRIIFGIFRTNFLQIDNL